MSSRTFAGAAFAVAALSLALPSSVMAQYYPPPPPYAPPSYPGRPPIGEEPFGPEHGQRAAGHAMFTLQLMPITYFGYNLGPGPESDLGYGASVALGYMTFWGLGLEAKVGVRRHSTTEIIDAAGDGFNFTQTVVPVAAGLRYDFLRFWGGGFDPYFGFHLGTAYYGYSDNTPYSLSQWSFMLDVGAGVDVWVGEFVELGLSYWFEYYNNIDDVNINVLAVDVVF